MVNGLVGDNYINFNLGSIMSMLLEEKPVCGLKLVINRSKIKKYGLELQFLERDFGMLLLMEPKIF